MGKIHLAQVKSGAATLPQADLLARTSAQDADDFGSVAQLQHYAKNESIVHAEALDKNVYFLRSGRVKIYQPADCGKEVVLWFCFPGEMFGFAEVVQGGDRVVNAVAGEASAVL